MSSSPRTGRWQCRAPRHLGESPPVARGKGSRVEQPEPHTPATLLLRAWSLVSMTEPRSHEGTCVMVSPPLPPCSSGPSSS